MYRRAFAGLILVASLFGYLEWGGGGQSFLFQAEAVVLGKLVTDPMAVAHPFVLVPLAGQLLLAIALFQREPSRKLIYAAIGMLSLLLLLVFLIGFLKTHLGMILSALPFLALSVTFLVMSRRTRDSSR